MLQNIVVLICNNKNVLMLLTVGIYIWALYAVLSSTYILWGVVLTLLLIFMLIKNIFPIKYILIWAFIFYFGIINTSLRIKNTDELFNLAPMNAVISGKICSIPQIKGEQKTKFFFEPTEIEIENEKRSLYDEKLLVTLDTTDKLKRFESYKINGRLSKPFKAGNPSQFDYGNYLRNYDAYAVFYGKDFSKLDIKPLKLERALQCINEYRERILTIHSYYLKSPNLEILGGIVFGDDAVSTPDDVRQSFINSGLLHILAASGMNVAFIFSFFFLIFSTLKVNYKVNISLGIITVLVYSLMTGLGASVVRAALMLIFVLVGKLIDRDAHSISLLSFVAFLMLIYNPMYINDVGFQLSFIVTLGLLLMTPYIAKSKSNLLNRMLGIIFIPIIAQLWVIPLQIFYFNNISLYSVFANIMSVPLLSVISFGGFVSSLLALITPIAAFVCKVFDFILNPLITLLINISDFWGKLPNSAIQTTHPAIFQIVIYYLILLCLTGFLNSELRNKYFKMLKNLFLVLIIILLVSQISIPNKNLEIMAFDVGNADAFLLKTPQNQYIMIDTGKSGYNGGKTQAEMIILKYLKDKGIRKLDTLIITHFDSDHCGGAADILKNVKVDNLYVNSLNHDSVAAKIIYQTAKEESTNVIPAENNQLVFNRDGLRLKNYMDKNCRENDDNDASIITLLEYNGFKMLFMGDAGVLTFNKLKQYLPPNQHVLKVGHHGAKNVLDKSMFDYLNPKVSLISVGENKFGHPDIQTIATLNKSAVVRTDKNNSVKISVRKDKYTVFVYSSDRKRYVMYLQNKI